MSVTKQQMLDAVNQAILDIARGGARVRLPDGREIEAADLGKLEELRRTYEAEISAGNTATQGGMFYRAGLRQGGGPG